MHFHRPILLVTLLLEFSLFAANDARGLDHRSIQHFTVEDGLSQGTIRAILQDHKGFIWVGTNDGLSRFDGVEFRTFRHRTQDPTTLIDNNITHLFEDHEQTLWVGTPSGLHRYDRATETFTRIVLVSDDSTRYTEYPVLSIYEMRYRGVITLWVDAYWRGVVDRKRNEVRQGGFGGQAASISIPVSGISEEKDGTIWMVNSRGLMRVDPRADTVEDILLLNNVGGIILIPRGDSLNTLWIGAATGLFKVDRRERTAILQLPHYVTSMLEDRKGRLWVGTEKGLHLLTQDGKPEATFVAGQGTGRGWLTDGYVLALCEDASGALWVGTFNGLNRLDEHAPAFTVYRRNPNDANSLVNDFVLPIMEDRDYNIWFGTFGGGLSILRRDAGSGLKFTNSRHDPARGGLCGNNVRSLLQDRQGNIWIGTDEGLNLYRPSTKSFTCFPIVDRTGMRFWVECLFESRDGTIWAGGVEMLRIDHQGDARITTAQYSLSKDSVGSSEAHVGKEDRYGVLWVGTEKGLVRFDPRTGAYTRYMSNPSDSTSLSNNRVFSIYEDPDDSTAILWVGTGDGLNRLNTKTGMFQRYLEQDGFPSACVYGILRDDLGRLWLSTNQGITCFDNRPGQERKFKNYDESDGLQGNEFNRRSYCRLQTGEFLFGGTHGVTRFHPMQIRANPYIPPVLLTSFSKFGRKVAFDTDITSVSHIELTYDENDLSFEYVALNYTNAIKNQYAYMMEGFDKNWTYSGGRRYAHYTHLDPGEYTFRVKASNNDGVWNERGTSVRVSITPPFWGTWWFKVFSAMLLVTGIVMFYRRRVQGLEKEKRIQQEFSNRLLNSQEQERKRIAGELHDSLGQNLLVIRNRALLGLKDESVGMHARDQLDHISTVATQAIDGVREISYNLRPYQLDRLGLTKAIMSIASGLGANIQFSVNVDPIDDIVDKDRAIHVYRIVQEGINNILKHSEATEASLVIRAEAGTIRITINDNGKGMPQGTSTNPEAKRGFGLVGIGERAKVLNGILAIDSTPGQGTRLTVTIPAAKDNS